MNKNVLAQISADEATFYAIAEKGWNECSSAQKVFIAFNSTYTPEYIANELKALQAAKDLPNQEVRLAVQTRMRAILESKAAICNNLVQNLYTSLPASPKAKSKAFARKPAAIPTIPPPAAKTGKAPIPSTPWYLPSSSLISMS